MITSHHLLFFLQEDFRISVFSMCIQMSVRITRTLLVLVSYKMGINQNIPAGGLEPIRTRSSPSISVNAFR